MIEVDKQTPVNEPGPLLQRLQLTAECALVYKLFQPGKYFSDLCSKLFLSQPVEILKSSVPVLHQDLGCQLAPHTIQIVLVSRLDQDAVEIQILT